MNQKNGNNNFDIVLEAEAILQAYSERCKVHIRKVKKEKNLKRKVWFSVFFVFGVAVAGFWFWFHV